MTTAVQPGQKQKSATLITPEFRLSYPYLFDPQKQQRQDGKQFDKYSCVMIFRTRATPESTARGEKIADLSALKALALAAVSAKWGPDRSKWSPKLFKEHPNGNSPFRDGALKETEGYGAGTLYVTAWSTFKPVVVDQGKNDVLDRNLVYPGVWARAVVSAFVWDNKQKGPGVSFNLHGVQLVKDDTPLMNRVDAKNEFDPIEAPASAATAATAAAPAGAGDPFADLG